MIFLQRYLAHSPSCALVNLHACESHRQPGPSQKHCQYMQIQSFSVLCQVRVSVVNQDADGATALTLAMNSGACLVRATLHHIMFRTKLRSMKKDYEDKSEIEAGVWAQACCLRGLLWRLRVSHDLLCSDPRVSWHAMALKLVVPSFLLLLRLLLLSCMHWS